MDPMTEASVLRSLGELHAKVDILLSEKTKVHDRITFVEKWMWSITGGMGLCMMFFVPKLKALIGF